MSHVIKSNVSIFLSRQTAPGRCCWQHQMKGTAETTKLERNKILMVLLQTWFSAPWTSIDTFYKVWSCWAPSLMITLNLRGMLSQDSRVMLSLLKLLRIFSLSKTTSFYCEKGVNYNGEIGQLSYHGARCGEKLKLVSLLHTLWKCSHKKGNVSSYLLHPQQPGVCVLFGRLPAYQAGCHRMCWPPQRLNSCLDREKQVPGAAPGQFLQNSQTSHGFCSSQLLQPAAARSMEQKVECLFSISLANRVLKMYFFYLFVILHRRRWLANMSLSARF